MPWSELNSKIPEKQIEEHREKAAKLAQKYARCFGSDDGRAVLDHMVNTFIMSNDTPFETANINYQAAYKNGEAGLVKFILNQIKRASEI